MSKYKFNIPELMHQHFPYHIGYVGQAILDDQLNQFDDIPVLPTHSDLVGVSETGTPVWDYIRLNSTTIEGTGELFEGYDFPVATTIEAILPKKIVESDILGRDGQVEELIAMDDWSLTIRGLIINYESTDYPEQAVLDLKRVFSLKSSKLPVEGTYLTMLDIRYLTLHRLNLINSVGYSNIQGFEITAKSKIPFQIQP
ncbi:MAG TPA: DUF6046 domain-containing protein [Moheibacter sp.]|nr:DUF6046 domain-containing protein [Moheibacter sp.]